MDQCHNVEDKIPGQIRSVLNVQEMTAKALLVDADALAAAEVAGDDGNPQARQHKRRARASLVMPYFSFGQSLRPRS